MSWDTAAGRLTTWFDRLDVDRSGEITEDNFRAMARQLVEATGLGADSASGRAIEAAYLRLWRDVFLQGDSKGNGRLDIGEFIAAAEAGKFGSQSVADKLLTPIADAIMRSFDANHSGTLGLDEITKWLSRLGVSDSNAETYLAAMDRDGSGVVSQDELRRAISDYFLSDRPHPIGGLVFGQAPARINAVTHSRDLRRRGGGAEPERENRRLRFDS